MYSYMFSEPGFAPKLATWVVEAAFATLDARRIGSRYFMCAQAGAPDMPRDDTRDAPRSRGLKQTVLARPNRVLSGRWTIRHARDCSRVRCAWFASCA
jgi:hypothetical protein